MSMVGTVTLLIAFALCVLSVVLFAVSVAVRTHKPESDAVSGWLARMCSVAVLAALTVCCGVLVICFMNGDNSIQYVVDERSGSTGELAWLYRLSGLWAGRQGSLLFWAWLIAAFNTYLSLRHLDDSQRLDDLALGVSQLVELAFIALLFFSETNMPFIATPASYFDANGDLVSADLLGMNVLLEHWAMAVHPPTLFIGYAGLTLPFAYALAAIVLGDDSTLWVERVNGVTAFAWMFLGVGIGLGAVWAYVVLGWGGYWGWDPVENASLLSWLVATALMHSFTLYRTRGTFKRWSVVCACFAFMFVIVGTFISRSGLVQSVHAFSGDEVSLVLFVALIAIAALSGLFGVVGRRKSFAVAPVGAGQGDDEGFFTREMGYTIGNAMLVIGAFVLAYLTLASALPSWLPLGGTTVGAETYNSLARPLGLLFMLVVAIGPMMGWKKADASRFWRTVLAPGMCALVLFGVLLAYFVAVLLPVYEANLSAGDEAAVELAALGPSWYYNGLAVASFAVASLLIFNSLFLLGRAVRGHAPRAATGKRAQSLAELGRERMEQERAGCREQVPTPATGLVRFRRRCSTIAGMLAHAALGIILIGLVGSTMYVSDESGYLASSSESEAATELVVKDYAVTVTGSDAVDADGDGYLYSLVLSIKQGDADFAMVEPKVQVDPATLQQRLIADVVSLPLQDVFVVYNGVNIDNDYSIEVRVNPLISFVWAGLVLLICATALGCFAKRPYRVRGVSGGGEVVV